MDLPEFENLSPEALRNYMAKEKEKNYVLIDVRQPDEYTGAHIPGARLFPLADLQSKIFELPDDRDLVFYCHSGGRSSFAADLAAEAEVTEKKVFNLTGGIMGWDGKKLADFPRVQVFEGGKSLSELLMTAMELEKGAYRFYMHIVENHADEPFFKTAETLSKAETAHALSIYKFWEKTVSSPQPFDELFEALKGEILEGGEHLSDILNKMKHMDGNLCLNFLEVAMSIEYAAYDLYRTMAEGAEDEAAKEVFLNIAQAEKGHMRLLAEAVPGCAG